VLQSWGMTVLERIVDWIERISAQAKKENWPSPTRVMICVICGLFYAVAYSIWAAMVTAFGRGSETLASLGLSFTQVVGVYFTTGVMGGILLGLCWPLTRWKLGAGVLGFGVAFLLLATLTIIQQSVRDIGEFLFISVGGGFGGFVAGLLIWTAARKGV